MLDDRYKAIQNKFAKENLANLSDKELLDGQKQIMTDIGYYRSLELTVKRLANGVYGAFGTASNRYFLQALAEDICAEGQYYIKLMDKTQNEYFTGDWLNEVDFVKELKAQTFGHIIPHHVERPILVSNRDFVVYCDTDSTYTNGGLILQSLSVDYENASQRDCAELLKYVFDHKMNKIFADTLENVISRRHGNNVMDFELELIGGRGIFVEKKKYIITTLMHDGEFVGHKGWFKSTGIEIQQAGSSKQVHNIIKSFINAVFTDWRQMTERKFFAICAAVKNKMQTSSIDDLAKINRCKTYSEYVVCDREKLEFKPKTGAVIRGAARYNQLIWQNNLQNKYPYVKDGTRCKWYYDANGEPFAYPCDINPYEIAPDMDINVQLDKLVFAPVQRLVSGLFNTKQSKLGSNQVQLSFSSRKIQ